MTQRTRWLRGYSLRPARREEPWGELAVYDEAQLALDVGCRGEEHSL
jgi:hypothetical protein